MGKPRTRAEWQVGISTRHVVRRRDLVEEVTSRRTAPEVDGMWEDGCQSDHSGVHRGESKRCVANENRPKETSHGEIGSKQLGNGCGCPVAQKRR